MLITNTKSQLRKSTANRVVLIVAAILVFVLDQFCKANITPTVLNTNAGFGIFIPGILAFSIIFSTLALLAVKQNRFLILPLLIVASSNLLDRIRLGAIVDYIQFLGVWFNLADVFVVIMLGWILILELRQSEHKDREQG